MYMCESTKMKPTNLDKKYALIRKVKKGRDSNLHILLNHASLNLRCTLHILTLDSGGTNLISIYIYISSFNVAYLSKQIS